MRSLTLRVAAGLMAVAGFAPVLLAQKATLPAPARNLKPHLIVESVLYNQIPLGLSEQQVTKLNEWHVAVRDEKHQFVIISRGKGSFLVMKPMISRERAYQNTVAALTPEQQKRWLGLLAAGAVPSTSS